MKQLVKEIENLYFHAKKMNRKPKYFLIGYNQFSSLLNLVYEEKDRLDLDINSIKSPSEILKIFGVKVILVSKDDFLEVVE